MAARKKASKKSSRTVSKKTKASARSSPSRKRKAVASAPASRPSRSAAKSKAARSAKAKSGKSASARRSSVSAKTTKASKSVSATAKTRAAKVSARALPATAAKPGKSVDVKLQVSQNQAKELSKALGQKPAGAIEAKVSRETPAPARPPIAKASALPLAKRAPIAAKASRPGPSDNAPERDEEGSAPKPVKSSSHRQGFKLNEFVVYPAHGVGQIVAVEDQEVAGFRLELFVINFAKDKMTLRVPTSKVVGVGMRKLSEPDVARRSLDILTGRARIKRTMWSRRAQEYEAKINSGDINAIAEVVRDLYRSDAQPEQSYSERQLYEAALDRMMREIAAVQKLSEIDALKVIEAQLKKAQRRGAKSETADGEDAAIEEAA